MKVHGRQLGSWGFVVTSMGPPDDDDKPADAKADARRNLNACIMHVVEAAREVRRRYWRAASGTFPPQLDDACNELATAVSDLDASEVRMRIVEGPDDDEATS